MQSEVEELKNSPAGSSRETSGDAQPTQQVVKASPSSSILTNAGAWAVPLLLVVLFISFSVASPDTFASTGNVRVMIGGQAVVLLLAMALLVPLRAGDFDLSVSSVMILSGCFVATLSEHNQPLLIACLAGVLVGPVVGLINATLVVRFGIDSLIATLGTLTALRGVAILVSDSQVVVSIPTGLRDFATYKFLGFGTPVWAGWLVAVGLWYLFEMTPFGRYLLFVGGNPGSARLAGLKVDQIRQTSFIISGTLASLTGLLFSGALGSVDPGSGGAYLLPPVTAAFLGASAIKLGRFNVAGTVIAIYLLAVGITGLQLLGLQSWVADVFNGTCLVAAVGFSILFRRAGAK